MMEDLESGYGGENFKCKKDQVCQSCLLCKLGKQTKKQCRKAVKLNWRLMLRPHVYKALLISNFSGNQSFGKKAAIKMSQPSNSLYKPLDYTDAHASGVCQGTLWCKHVHCTQFSCQGIPHFIGGKWKIDFPINLHSLLQCHQRPPLLLLQPPRWYAVQSRCMSPRIFCSFRLFSSMLNMAKAAFSSAVYTCKPHCQACISWYIDKTIWIHLSGYPWKHAWRQSL